MPIYEYECTQCHHVFEVLQKFSEKPLRKCRHCSGRLQKLVSQSAFHLKGSGWYVTDYANKKSHSAGSQPNKTPASAETKNTPKGGSDQSSPPTD
jgi:putative FmdB family regulatory protein